MLATLNQELGIVNTLSTGHDFFASHEQVIRVRIFLKKKQVNFTIEKFILK